MARYTLVYGIRLVPEGALKNTQDARLELAGGETAHVTLHTIDGTIPQLRRALDRSLDAFFDFLPGAADEDRATTSLARRSLSAAQAASREVLNSSSRRATLPAIECSVGVHPSARARGLRTT